MTGWYGVLVESILTDPLVDAHGLPDLLAGDGHALVLEQLLEGEHRGEHPRVTHRPRPVEDASLRN